MSNPSGDGTILSLPLAANFNGTEVIPADQKQGDLYYTVRVPLSSLAGLIVTGVNVGTTAQRPIAPAVGQPYFDTTLGLPIWCKQASPTVQWVNASGFGPV